MQTITERTEELLRGRRPHPLALVNARHTLAERPARSAVRSPPR